MKVHTREVIIKQACFKLLCYNDHMENVFLLWPKIPLTFPPY